MSDLYELSRPFTKEFVKKPPAGKYGDYVKHSTVNERLLSIVGPFTYALPQIVYGAAPEIKTTGQQSRTYPGRDHAVVGCVGRLTVTIDGRTVSVEEAGDVENPAMNLDGRNLKDASSDAFKRCCMRLGLGLHLWSGTDYFLDKQLHKQESTIEGDDDGRTETEDEPERRQGNLPAEESEGGEAETLEGIT